MMEGGALATIVIPAKAGIQCRCDNSHWVPAFAGTTTVLEWPAR